MAPITARQSGWVQFDTPDGQSWFQVSFIAAVLPTGMSDQGAYIYPAFGEGSISVHHSVAEVMDRIERARKP